MNSIIIGTKNETSKIFSKKKFIFLFSISLLVTVAASTINLLSSRNFGAPLLNNANLPVTVLNFMSSLLLPLFILMLTSDLFSGEFSDNSIVMSLVRPITRNKLYISKILAIGISILFLLLGTFLISLIASLFGGNLSTCLSKLPSNFIAYVSAVIPMLLVAIITAFAAQFTKSGSLTVVIMILASIFMSAASLIFPEIIPFMPTTYLTWYQNFYTDFNLSIILNQLLYILAYGIIFMFAGTYLFTQKDIS
ncbi:ABC transporter permease [Acetivibrio cellulolyticus]|uniref:ABC transporter permease n=1 Tax=Acetivibrio cellulolyticus TaxID=35830 RepID=UPI0001E2EC21|nr:ABC transporter permease [Acetivibrio cellulolyticus]